MISNELRHDIRKAWVECGKAITTAFGYPEGSLIEAGTIEQLLQQSTEADGKVLLARIQQLTREIEKSKSLGQ